MGENPGAADAMGVNVFAFRYFYVLVGGMLAGLGGVYLSLVYNASWLDNMTAGRGWIAVALVIFATWNPVRALIRRGGGPDISPAGLEHHQHSVLFPGDASLRLDSNRAGLVHPRHQSQANRRSGRSRDSLRTGAALSRRTQANRVRIE